MSFLSGLPRSWVSIQGPGTSSRTLLATYVAYSTDALPCPPRDIAGLEWLKQAQRHPEDYMATAFESAVRDPSRDAVTEMLGDLTSLPADVLVFIEDGLRDRLRSTTDSYFDLGDSVVSVDGGRLLHLISDSQWVFHWLLYLGDEGDSAVVGTSFPAGFDLDLDEVTFWQAANWGYVVVADSFAEFIWRWWMDNEVFYRVEVEGSPLNGAEQSYTEQYGTPQEQG
jgi:hypothetical protein